MKVLVAATDYPTLDGRRSLYYIHSRNLQYIKMGIDVVVLSFACKETYIIDRIKVISVSDFEKCSDRYRLLICHAANLRNHYLFIRKYNSNFDRIIFVFHGHEILHLNKYYPKPFFYYKKNEIPKRIQDLYDTIKIDIWKNFILNNKEKVWLIFVSNWIYDQFLKETRISPQRIENHYAIISNSVGSFFEEKQYCPSNIEYDFISIRTYMDRSKYGVDIIVKLAEENPDYKFLMIGRGDFFSHYKKPDNMEWLQKELTHEEMEKYLNRSRIALLPTREDTQGLMACELASFGMPLITSDIEVCREVFRTCPNAAFINNDNPDLKSAIKTLKLDLPIKKWTEYYAENTVKKEIELIMSLG